MGYDIVHKRKEIATIFSYMSKGQSVAKALSNRDVSCGLRTFWTWLASDPNFQRDYARAWKERALFLFEETEVIANDNEGLTYYCAKSKATKFDPGAIRNKEVILTNRRWFLSKLDPERYADKIHLNMGGLDNTKSNGFDINLLQADTLALIERDLKAIKTKSLSGAILSQDIQDVEEVK